MAFDKSQPTNTTKIRNLGVVIRPNWDAIEEAQASLQLWGSNYVRRNGVAPSNDPTAIANNVIVYAKNDSSGNAQLYAIDDASNVLQVTGGAPTKTANGEVFLTGAVYMKWGQFTFSGTSTTHNYSTGAFPNNTLSVVVTPINQVAGIRVSTWNASGFSVATALSVSTASFAYQAIGF